MKDRISNWLARLQVNVGATVVEYTFIIAIVSIVGALLLAAIGRNTNDLLEMTNTNMPQ